jgi:hypothetical protein
MGAWPCSPAEVTATSTVTHGATTDEEAQSLEILRVTYPLYDWFLDVVP